MSENVGAGNARVASPRGATEDLRTGRAAGDNGENAWKDSPLNKRHGSLTAHRTSFATGTK